jgi:hypothetical protein
MTTCLFGDGEAVARYELPEGCVAFRDVIEQNLCMQHIVSATPIGEIRLIECYVDHERSELPCQVCGQK